MTCEEIVKRNLGLSRCKLPAQLKCMVTLPKGTTMTVTEFQTLSEWNDRLLNPEGTRCYLWPLFRMVENQAEDAVYEQTALSTMKVRDGQYRWKVYIHESLCLHTKLYTHNSEGDVDVIFIDVENNWIATTTEAGLVKGFSVDLINAEKLLLSDGSVSTKSPLYISLADNKELDRRGIMAQNDFLDQLYRIVDVGITIVDYSGNDSFRVDVATLCDGTPVQGLLIGDFIVLNNAGADQAPTTIVEDDDVPGRYTITKVDALVDGTIALSPSADLTSKAYEFYGDPVAVNIP